MHANGSRSIARLRTVALQALAGVMLASGILHGPQAATPTAVAQRGYNHSVTGANLTETTLNTSNVALDTFGMIFAVPVDDAIFAQPLYVPGVAIPNQGTHNVVYVATMSDTLYAFDAENGAELWSVNLASAVNATPVPIAKFVFNDNKNIVGNLGILSTPVIDTSTNLMFVVSCTLENNAMTYRLWAVNITDGGQPHGAGKIISGTYGGSTFDARDVTQRMSLALGSGNVIFGFGALEGEEAGNYVGWVMQYNKNTLAQNGIFATVTTGSRGGGVWQSGRPPALDSSAHAYVYVGNGWGNGYNGTSDFSESALKLDLTDKLALADWFTPDNWSTLDTQDKDLSSSGPLLIPGTSPLLLAGGGKGGTFYLLNTTNLGKETSNNGGAVQQIAMTTSFRGGPVLWERSAAQGGTLLYNWSWDDVSKSFEFDGTKFTTTPVSKGSITALNPGGILTLSAWGARHNTGILWATRVTSGDEESDPPVPGALYAFNAENLSQDLWDSTMDASRDGFGNFAKFAPALVENGRLYVPTWSKQLAVYGLLSSFLAEPMAVAFETQPPRVASKPVPITVTNTGNTALIIKSIVLASTGPDPFSQTNDCAEAVPAGAHCTINVVFNPAVRGAARATLSVSTGTAASTQTVALSGSGS